MDPITSPVAVARALRKAREELGAALMASTLTRPTRAADAVCQHITGAAHLLDAVTIDASEPTAAHCEAPQLDTAG